MQIFLMAVSEQATVTPWQWNLYQVQLAGKYHARLIILSDSIKITSVPDPDHARKAGVGVDFSQNLH